MRTAISSLTRVLASAALACSATLSVAADPAPGAMRKLYVANTSGDSLSVIDLARREIIGEIKIGKHPHGLAASPDGRSLYVSVESERVVKVIDAVSDKPGEAIPTTGVPNQLAITPDGRWVYVAINSSGKADVIDV